MPELVEQGEWIDWLMAAVGQLPARQRDALVGHAFEGRSYREIAARDSARVVVIEGDRPIDTIHQQIAALVDQKLRSAGLLPRPAAASVR